MTTLMINYIHSLLKREHDSLKSDYDCSRVALTNLDPDASEYLALEKLSRDAFAAYSVARDALHEFELIEWH